MLNLVIYVYPRPLPAPATSTRESRPATFRHTLLVHVIEKTALGRLGVKF